MRNLFSSIAAAALLGACATATPVTAPTQDSQAAPQYASLAAQLLVAAGRADAPNQAEIERAFGAADIARHDGAGAAWTYRLDSCALLLLFTADARNELRLAEAHAGARRQGQPAPSLDQCAAEMAARRS